MHNAYTQGCSDAGFCTLHSSKQVSQHTDAIATANRFAAGISTGSADNNIAVYGGYVDYSRTITDNIRCDLKVSFLSQHGPSIRSSGLSDFFMSATYSFSEFVNSTVGVKLPFGNGNATENGLSLPMDFQPSLGTIDLILGFGYSVHNVNFVVALQQPLTQNKNRFIAEQHPFTSELRTFATTNNFKRSGDILLRVSYPFRLTPAVTVTPGVLPIYHLDDDTYTDLGNNERPIIGSSGLTVNANIFLKYSFNELNSAELSFGAPVKTRSARPDGLTRSVVLTLEYSTVF